MKFLTIFVSCFLLATSAWTSEKTYVLVNPNTPGSNSDITARALAEVYKRQTGNTLQVHNVGGGNQIPGVLHFKQLGRPAIFLNTTSTLVFNYKMMEQVPYQDSDFDHVTSVSLSPGAWVVRADSPYRDMKHLVQTLPHSAKPFVAYANNFELANILMVSQRYHWSSNQVTPVKYKGQSEVVLGLLSGDIDVATVSLVPSIVEQVKNQQLKVLGSTANTNITVNGQTIFPVERLIQVEQFSGGNFLSLSPRFDPTEAKQLKKDLMEALKDPKMIESLNSRNQLPMQSGERFMTEFIDNYRKKIAPLDLGPKSQ